jgi:zinc protease
VSLFLIKFAQCHRLTALRHHKPGDKLIRSSKYTLANGLRIIVHNDPSTPIVAVNTLFNVGSKNEDPSMTGFAHLFEHLMFGGTRAIRNFDRHLEIAGGESNAFTNSDITNYYITIPSANIETALWLESDRLQGLDLSARNIRVQKDVVTEEYRQRFLNQPYGDAMLNLRPLVYRSHPYRWHTIGMDLSHIERAGQKEVKNFFEKYYKPDNAILSIAGNISPKKAFKLAEKWFAPIQSGARNLEVIPTEPEQTEARRLEIERAVPANVLYKAWVVSARSDPEFHVFDMISDILSGGESGRLYNSLVREKRLCNEVNCYLTGETDRGMMIITASLAEGIAFDTAESAIAGEITRLCKEPVSGYEYQKVINRYQSEFHLNHTGILAKATSLAFHEHLGDAGNINSDVSNYSAVTRDSLMSTASAWLTEERSSTLCYRAVNE